jgi:flagellar biosynthesis chaperone FliJ
MPRDALEVLRELRRRDVDRRRRELADCTAAETEAAGRVRSIDAAMARDRDSENGLADRMRFRDIFLATRQHLRSERQRAVAALAEAEARSEAARGQLAAARQAAEAVDRLILERTAAARAKADRRAQHELDDIARLRRK